MSNSSKYGRHSNYKTLQLDTVLPFLSFPRVQPQFIWKNAGLNNQISLPVGKQTDTSSVSLFENNKKTADYSIPFEHLIPLGFFAAPLWFLVFLCTINKVKSSDQATVQVVS